MASKKAPGKRKRYTDEEKKTVRDFVTQHNSEHGRGGAAAASKKFGINQISIGSWLKSTVGQSKPGKAAKGAQRLGNRSAIVAELIELDQQLTSKRGELAALQARFDLLKNSL